MLLSSNGQPMGKHIKTPAEVAYEVQMEEIHAALQKAGGQFLLIFNKDGQAGAAVSSKDEAEVVALFSSALVQNPRFRVELLMAFDATLTESLRQVGDYEGMLKDEEAEGDPEL